MRSRHGSKRESLSIPPTMSFRRSSAPWSTSSSTLNSNLSNSAPWTVWMWYDESLKRYRFFMSNFLSLYKSTNIIRKLTSSSKGRHPPCHKVKIIIKNSRSRSPLFCFCRILIDKMDGPTDVIAH